MMLVCALKHVRDLYFSYTFNIISENCAQHSELQTLTLPLFKYKELLCLLWRAFLKYPTDITLAIWKPNNGYFSIFAN